MALVLDSRKDGSESVNGYLCGMAAGSFSLLAFCHFSATSLPCLLVRIPWHSIVLFRQRVSGRCLDHMLRFRSLFFRRGICRLGVTSRNFLRARSDIDYFGSPGANPAI